MFSKLFGEKPPAKTSSSSSSGSSGSGSASTGDKSGGQTVSSTFNIGDEADIDSDTSLTSGGVTSIDRSSARLNASAGIIKGVQADRYEIGDQVFVKYEAVAWPARIEDPSCVHEIVTRYQYAVFLYGIHERLVMKLKDIFVFDENRKEFGKKTVHRILNMALVESRTDPDVNLRRIPYHHRKPCRLLRKTRSHTLLDRYLDADMPPSVSGSDVSVEGSSDQFYNRGILSYDRSLGYFAIIFSFMFMMYMTLWIVLLPFLDASYHAVIQDMFMKPSHGFAYPIAGGTIVASSVIAFFGAVMYGPRVDGHQWMVVTPQAELHPPPPDRYKRMEDLVKEIRKRRRAIMIIFVFAMIFMTPFRVIALAVIVFGSFHLIRDLLMHM